MAMTWSRAGRGFDTLDFSGDDRPDRDETFSIDPPMTAPGHVIRPQAISYGSQRVERIEFKALGSADNITINDLTGTDVKEVAIDLGGADNITIDAQTGTDLKQFAIDLGADDPDGDGDGFEERFPSTRPTAKSSASPTRTAWSRCRV